MSKHTGRFRDPITGQLPRIAGASPDSPVTYPLDPASVEGTLITLDQYVENPTVITRSIAELSEQRMYAHRIFSSGPGVDGGAILFERPNPLLTDLYAERRMQEVAPGAQFPELTFARGVPMVQRPKKIGGKFDVTKEDRKRNRPQLVLNAITQAGNTLVRDVETMALGELNAVIAAESRTVSGQSWSTAAEATFNTKSAKNQPLADFIHAQVTIDMEERGVVLNGAILNPLDWANLTTIYGADNVASVLASAGITEYYTTPRQTHGKVKLYQAGTVGIWSNEFPLDQKTWEVPETDDTFWYQWSISPVMAVENQFAVVELTGVA